MSARAKECKNNQCVMKSPDKKSITAADGGNVGGCKHVKGDNYKKQK